MVDHETENRLLRWKDEIIGAVTKTIKESNEHLESRLREVHDLRFQGIEKDLENQKELIKKSFQYHDEHYKAEKEHVDRMAAMKESLSERIDKLESRQSMDEGKELGSNKALQNEIAKKSLIYTAIGLVIAGLGLVGGSLL